MSHPSQVASAVSSVVADGPAAGCRAVDLRVWGGLDLRLLPDRGLDVGAAWFGGVPLGWISGLGEHAPRGGDFSGSWGGGLMTTCGLRNVGLPSEGHGQHGEYHQQAAGEVAVERGDGWLEVRGVVREGEAPGALLELRRAVRTYVGSGRVELTDVTRNVGPVAEAAPLLYHCNLGAPLWVPGATVRVARGRRVVPRDALAEAALDGWDRCPGVRPDQRERVFEHELDPGDDGWGEVRVESPALGLAVAVRWDAATLPRVHQWVDPRPGVEVLGIEPANCSVDGRAADRAAGRLPELAPGDERTTRLELLVERL